MAKPDRERQRERDVDRLFHDFEIVLAQAIPSGASRHPDALHMLGHALTRTGRHQEALEVDLRLTSLKPKDPVAFYNLACSYSHLENLDGAFDALHRAFELGYRDYKHLLRDPDLEKVRRDHRFKELLHRKWGKRRP
jgi:Flp pilus assembly protein TadD